MSAAFRNFILTLVIMLGIFAYTALKILPDIEGLLFFDDVSSGEESETVSEPSAPEDESGEETSEEFSGEEQYDVFSCIFASKNEKGDICSLIYVEALEETQKYITCRIPVDIYLDDSGVPKLLCELMGDNDADYMIKKISPLIGRDVDFYIICDGETYKTAAKTAEKAGSAITVDLTYEIRYIDPDFAGVITSEEATDEYYITLPVGKTALTETNAVYIFNSLREGDAAGYPFQESMGLSVFRQIASVGAFSSNIETLTTFYNSVRTNIPVAELSRYAGLLFAYSSYGNTHITYPTTFDYNSPEMKIADWSNGIKQIKSAES